MGTKREKRPAIFMDTVRVDGVQTAVTMLNAGSLAVTNNANVGGTLGITGVVTATTNIKAGSLAVTNNATIGGTLNVTGIQTAVTMLNAGSFSVTNNANIGGTLGITGVVTATTNIKAGSLAVTNNATIGGTMQVGGAVLFALTSGEDFSAKQGYIAAFGVTNGVVVIPSALTQLPAGVISGTALANGRPTLARAGICNVVSKGDGTAIVAGDQLTFDATGMAIKALGATNFIVGVALEGSQTDAYTIQALLGFYQRSSTWA